MYDTIIYYVKIITMYMYITCMCVFQTDKIVPKIQGHNVRPSKYLNVLVQHTKCVHCTLCIIYYNIFLKVEKSMHNKAYYIRVIALHFNFQTIYYIIYYMPYNIYYIIWYILHACERRATIYEWNFRRNFVVAKLARGW